MDKSKYIAIETFCRHHQLTAGFIELLESRGLLQITVYEQSRYLPLDYLDHLEKWIRLHKELEIHPEDIDVVEQLLSRVAELQEENLRLRDQLEFYKGLSKEQ